MRILHVIATFAPAWQFGGPVRSTFELCRALRHRGHQVTVVTTQAGTPLAGRHCVVHEVLEGIDVLYCPARSTPFGIVSSTMTSIVREQSVRHDVAHLTGVWQPTSRPVAEEFIRAGLPYLSSPRGALSPYSFSQGLLKKRLYYWAVERRIQRHAASIHVTAPLEAREVERLRLGVPICEIPNICSSERWYPDPEAGARWRRRLGIEPSTFVITHVGRVQRKKNIEFLAKVARALPTDRDWRFVLYGPVAGRDRGYLRWLQSEFPGGRLIANQGSSEESDVRGAYCGSDCVVMPSRHENFGNVAVEAALSGTPVVASDQVGAASLLQPLGACVVVALAPGEWAHEIISLADNPGHGRGGPGSRDSIARAASMDQVGRAFDDCYREVAR